MSFSLLKTGEEERGELVNMKKAQQNLKNKMSWQTSVFNNISFL